MKPVSIGKGLSRITVRSKTKLERLSKIPSVHIDGTRVVFPEWMIRDIKLILNPQSKRKTRSHQVELFKED